MEFGLEELFLMFAVMIALCVIIWIIVAILYKQNKEENARKPIRTEKVCVVEKQPLSTDSFASLSMIWVIFETTEHERIRLQARGDNHLVVGDVGNLTWQGSNIIRFERMVG